MPISNISAGLLDDRVKPLFPTISGKDGFGHENVTWVAGTVRPAHVKYLHGTQSLNVGEVWHPSTIYVTMRYTAVITDRCRIEWEGKKYYIESLNGSRREGKLVLTCELIDEGNPSATE